MIPSFQVPAGYDEIMFVEDFYYKGHEITVYDLSKCDLWSQKKNIIEFRCEHASVLTEKHRPTIQQIRNNFDDYCDECC